MTGTELEVAGPQDVEPTIGMSPKQRASFVAAETSTVAIFEGSIRAGKTFSWLLLLLLKVMHAGPLGAIVIVGKNRDAIYRNIFEPIEQIPALAPFRAFVNYRQGAPKATIFGRTCHVIGANDAGSESRIRGMTVQLAFCDEVTILDQGFFKQLRGRMSVKGAQLFGTTNPDGPSHWLRKEYLSKVPGTSHYDPETEADKALHDWSVVHFVMDDNPSLTEEYKAQMRREYTGLWYQRMILGRWVAAEGAIYDMFDADRHVTDTLPEIDAYLAVGIDHGTTNPTAGILLGLGRDDRLYALDEWHPDRGTDAHLATDLARWQAARPVPEWTYVDPAAASFRLELYEREWPGLMKARNDVVGGIRLVASLLATDRLKIHPRCTRLLDEIPGYRWDAKASENGEDKPIKEADHFCDALRYAVASTYNLWQPALGIAAPRQETAA